MDDSNRVLVFSISVNYYNKIFDRCIVSQRQYARKHNYDYILVEVPHHFSFLESAWLKIPLISSAIKTGYDWIFFLDADCEIRPCTPSIKSIDRFGKSIYMGLGFSGNINSGVIIVKNTIDALLFFEKVLQASTLLVPETDLGENGHMIHFAKQYQNIIEILPIQWNNNTDPKLDDYIRHYSSGGPMRPLYNFSFRIKFLQFILNLRNKIMKALRLYFIPRDELCERLQRMLSLCQKNHPEFGDYYNHDIPKLVYQKSNSKSI